jgi:hypothetical protein
METETASFDLLFKQLVERTCIEWGYSFPGEKYYLDVYARLPEGLRRAIFYGLQKGIILDAGSSKTGSAAFRPSVTSEEKGPYSWFERDITKKRPRPTWEYYVQVAEFIRLYESLKEKGYGIKFEDELMDIGVYEREILQACCEVKEKSSKAEELIRGIRKFQRSATLPEEDRGNDPLRKAKYISRLKPLYFYVVAIGRRYEYRVEYPEKMQFKLVEDFIPII